MDYTQFKDIIDNVQNNPDPESVIDKYNISIKAMIDIVEKVRPKLQTNISKVRFTRFLNILLKKYMGNPIAQLHYKKNIFSNTFTTKPTY